MAEGKREANWNAKLEQVRQFASDHDRWPSTTADDESERKLGQWWSRAKYQFNKTREGSAKSAMPDHRVEAIQDLIRQFPHLERDGVWETRLASVRKQIETEGRLWRYDTSNVEDLRTLRWWNQQKTFLKKFRVNSNEAVGGMTNDRANQIEALMAVIGDQGENSTPDQEEVEESPQPHEMTVSNAQ